MSFGVSDIVAPKPLPSIRDTLNNQSRAAMLRVSLVSLLIFLSIGMVAGIFHFRSRAQLVAEGLQNNLAHLLGVGDYFQIKRQIGSMVESRHFAGIWVFESVRHKMVAEASAIPGFLPSYDERKSNTSFVFAGHLYIASNFPISGPTNGILGTLRLAVQIPVETVLLLSLALLLVFLSVSWLAMRHFNGLAFQITEPIVTFSSYIQGISFDSPSRAISPTRLRFREIVDSSVVFNGLMERLTIAKQKEKEAEKNKAAAAVAQQVSHDIRSPLTALFFLMDGLHELPEQKRNFLRSAINRIHDIANNLDVHKLRVPLVGAQTSQQDTGGYRQGTFLLSPILDSLISEKRVLFSNRPKIRIDFVQDGSCYAAFVKLDSAEFKSAISNLVNNAVEAIESEIGEVSVCLRKRETSLEIEILDNGKGIPLEIRPNLGQRGFSRGKKSGSGLGIFHAKQVIETAGGVLDISSDVGKGTKVKILLPTAEPPRWFVPEIRVQKNTHVVIVDDDDSIHHVWKHRFFGSGLAKVAATHHFRSEDQLSTWIREVDGHGECLYLLDYELHGSKNSGLNLVRQFGIEKMSIIVTSHHDEASIYSECELRHIGLIPKNLAGYVPIVVEEERSFI